MPNYGDKFIKCKDCKYLNQKDFYLGEKFAYCRYRGYSIDYKNNYCNQGESKNNNDGDYFTEEN